MPIIKSVFGKALITRDYDTIRKLRTKIEQLTLVTSSLDNVEFLNSRDFNYYTKDMI